MWSLAERGSVAEGTSILTTGAPDSMIQAQGMLVSSIGLHAATRAGDVHLAAAHLQAFEALGFVAHLGAAGREGSRLARALTAETPARDHYRLVADIAERWRARRADASAFALRASAGQAVLDEAASSERMRIDGLRDASVGFALRAPAGPASARPERGLHARLRWRIRHRPLALARRVDPVLLGGLAAAALVYCAATAGLVLLLGGSADIVRLERPLAARSAPARKRPARARHEPVSRRSSSTRPTARWSCLSRAACCIRTIPPPASGRRRGPSARTISTRPDIRLLASSTDEGSGALWGVTADGGLVRRLNGRWQVIVGDAKFLGRRGTPVQQAELSAVAASPDAKWLLAAAGAEGVGLQDLERRRWLSRDEISPNGGPAAVTHAVWWRDRFYVGGPEGVSELAVDRPSTGLGQASRSRSGP